MKQLRKDIGIRVSALEAELVAGKYNHPLCTKSEPKHTNQILRQTSQPKLVSQAHMRNLMKPGNDRTRCDVVARVMATPIPHLAEISSQNNDSPEHAVNSNPDVECIPPGEILLTQRQPHVEDRPHVTIETVLYVNKNARPGADNAVGLRDMTEIQEAWQA